MSIVDDALNGLTIRIDSTLSPWPITVDLTPDPNSDHTFAKIARPHTVVMKNGETLYEAAPYGDPQQTKLLVLGGMIVLILLLIAWVER